MTLAERVKLAREKRGLSRVAVATGSGMSKAYVSLLESGSGGVNPKLPTLERLAATLAVPLPWLAFGEGPDPEWDAPAAPAEPQAEAAG